MGYIDNGDESSPNISCTKETTPKNKPSYKVYTQDKKVSQDPNTIKGPTTISESRTQTWYY